MCSFSMATSYSVKGQDGQYTDQVEWHNITAWNRLAEICQQYLHKGSKVFIEGHLKTESWEDKQTGTKKYMTKIIADNMVMLDGKGDRGDAQDFDQSRQSTQGSSQRTGARPATEDDPITNSDIPF